MGLLDFDENFTPRYKAPRFSKKDAEVDEEQIMTELNNMGRKKVSEDFSDSPHLDN